MITPAMADSVRPDLIPAVFARPPDGVLIYADGSYEWSASQAARFPRHISISVTGDPRAARIARAIDVEHGDATPADVPGFVHERLDLGHPDATVYCDRSTVGQVLLAAPDLPYRFIIATLDDVYRTPDELAAQLAATYDCHLAASRIWAIQWARRTTYDQSAVFGPPDWDHHPPAL